MHRVGYGLACAVQQSRVTERIDTEHWLVTSDKRFALSPGENVIGRDPGCVVWLDSTSVSRRHARIAIGDTGVHLEDLGSKNGTRVGDTTIGDAVLLRDGDRIVIGNVPLTYRISTAGLSTETHVSGTRTRRP
jgi:predicted component of type VI protein secretion system